MLSFKSPVFILLTAISFGALANSERSTLNLPDLNRVWAPKAEAPPAPRQLRLTDPDPEYMLELGRAQQLFEEARWSNVNLRIDALNVQADNFLKRKQLPKALNKFVSAIALFIRELDHTTKLQRIAQTEESQTHQEFATIRCVETNIKLIFMLKHWPHLTSPALDKLFISLGVKAKGRKAQLQELCALLQQNMADPFSFVPAEVVESLANIVRDLSIY